MSRLFSACTLLALLVFLGPEHLVLSAQADTFGSGLNSFEIEFVAIGEPGNPADTTGQPNPAGAVSYEYRIGKYEISELMIDKANAEGGLGLTHSGLGADKPATNVSWFEAAQFVNWLNISTGHMPAYKFVDVIGPRGGVVGSEFTLWEPTDPGYNPNNLFRNRRAKYVLPSSDEWYKAAYFDPTTDIWYDYPTGSDTPPTAVASGNDPMTAVFLQDLATGPADIMQAGGLSPFGTMAQGGNVEEWGEMEIDFVNNDPFARRIFRGGFWEVSSFSLSATAPGSGFPGVGVFGVGFRVISIPEPVAFSLLVTGLLTAIVGHRGPISSHF